MTALVPIKRTNQLNFITEIKDNYTYQVRTWIKWMNETGEEISEDGIKNYFTWLNQESGFKARTISIKRCAVKKRIRQLYKEATIDERVKIDRVLYELDHEAATASPKVNTSEITKDKVLDNEEYLQLLNVCRSERQRMFIYFLNATGSRVTEMINIKLSDCVINGETVKIRVIGKGNKERHLRIPLDKYEYIQTVFNGNEYLFETGNGKSYNRCYVSNQIHKIGLRINRNISAHSLRHSFATKKVNQFPGKIDAVSRYLGHSSVSITLDLYCHNQLSDEELFEDVI
jgi:integrase/recombinase XerD